MPREQSLYDGTKELCDLIDRAGNKAGFGRGQAFEDFLTLTVCTLATGLMEDEYLATVRYAAKWLVFRHFCDLFQTRSADTDTR